MTLLALLRHAETEWTAEARIQGRTDVPLSERGRSAMRGRALPERCQGLRVVTSPLARCVETAALLGAPDAAREPRLMEMDWGRWQGRRLEDLRKQLGKEMEENERRGLDFRPEGGESPREVLSRVSSWLEEIAAEGVPTLAVTHRGVIRVILAAALGWDLRGRPPVKLDWTAFQFFRLDAHGRPGVSELNVK